MFKSIEDLKLLIVDGMILKSKNGDTIEIKRFPNNIIKLYNKIISWVDFQEFLINGDYELIINEKQESLDFGKKSKWGGHRLAGIGKTLGRPKKGEKKKLVGIYLDSSTRQMLDSICAESNYTKSYLISGLIKNYYRR